MVEYAALAIALAGTATSVQQGRRQERQAKRAEKRQEQAQSVARSAAASERLAQAAESKRMRQRKPDASKIMAKARQSRRDFPDWSCGRAASGIYTLRRLR